MEEDEKQIKMEDCHEDKAGAGILYLTSKRVWFKKTRGRIMDFSKREGENVFEVPLGEVVKVWNEGLIIKKVCMTVKTKDSEKTFKFGVFSTGGWLEALQDAIEDSKNQ